MGQAEHIQDRTSIAAQASARYGSRGVPQDWYVDPADPDAAERYRQQTSSLENEATAFLAAHEALTEGAGVENFLDAEPAAAPRRQAVPERVDQAMMKASWAGRLTHCALKRTRRRSSLKRAAPRGMPRRSAAPATSSRSAWSMRWRMTRGSASGADFPSASAAVYESERSDSSATKGHSRCRSPQRRRVPSGHTQGTRSADPTPGLPCRSRRRFI